MHLDNFATTYSRAALHLETLRQEASAYQAGKATSPKNNYRLQLARSLQRLANWLEPTAPKGGRYVPE